MFAVEHVHLCVNIAVTWNFREQAMVVQTVHSLSLIFVTTSGRKPNFRLTETTNGLLDSAAARKIASVSPQPRIKSFMHEPHFQQTCTLGHFSPSYIRQSAVVRVNHKSNLGRYTVLKLQSHDCICLHSCKPCLNQSMIVCIVKVYGLYVGQPGRHL